MEKRRLICLNCDTQGHAFKNCKLPVRSYGIIGYKREEKLKYLLIQRRDTIGKTDFIRGKYKTNGKINYDKLKSLIEEMTDIERNEILTSGKEELWDNLWLDHNTGIYRNEKTKAMKLFEEIDYVTLLKESNPSRYSSNEWGFPKGRKNLKEDGLSCAIREFKEETGLSGKDFKLYDDTSFVEEFTASDGNKYTHIYFLAEINKTVEVSTEQKTIIFDQEVKDIGFFNFKQAYNMFRDYDHSKKNVLYKVNEWLNN